jgi:death-on-curing protein
MIHLTVAEVLYLHDEAIRRFGGTGGIRDCGLLLSALERPRMAVGGRDLYPSLARKAAALVESLARNHAFVDGNKRVAAYALGLFLERNGYRLRTRDLELSDFILDLAKGGRPFHEIAAWVRRHAVRDTILRRRKSL